MELRYRYPFASHLDEAPEGQARLSLASSRGRSLSVVGEELPQGQFFLGSLVDPAGAGAALRYLGDLARRRYFVPPGMLQRILAEADPVVTAGGGMLRFEAFSACCSVHARLDLEPDALVAEELLPGTTHVDFGPDLRAALSAVRRRSGLGLRIDGRCLELSRGDERVVEKKVRLSPRWLRAFLEIQLLQARMEPVGQLSGVAARRFLQQLPSQAGRGPTGIEFSGSGARVTSRLRPGVLAVPGIERLRELAGLGEGVRGLRIFRDSRGGSTGWILELGPQNLTVLLSPGRARGLSGEGGGLRDLSRAPETGLARVRAELGWESPVLAADLGARCDLEPEALAGVLATLGSSGLLGYDLGRGAWFHRPLPFDPGLVEALHPRLAAAKRLVEEGGVRLAPGSDEVAAEVRGSEVAHRVSCRDGVWRCTCPWHARTQGEQGPCKHVLAVELNLDGREAEA